MNLIFILFVDYLVYLLLIIILLLILFIIYKIWLNFQKQNRRKVSRQQRTQIVEKFVVKNQEDSDTNSYTTVSESDMSQLLTNKPKKGKEIFKYSESASVIMNNPNTDSEISETTDVTRLKPTGIKSIYVIRDRTKPNEKHKSKSKATKSDDDDDDKDTT